MKKILASALLAVATGGAALAQSYPAKSISMVNPGPPGGAIDNVARVIAAEMSLQLKSPIVMLNVDGAGGTLATARVAQAAPDGYTILFHHMGVATAPSLYRKLPFNALKDLVPLGLTTEVPTVIIARKDLPAATVPELVKFLKAQGDKISMGTTGPGNVADLCASVFMARLGDSYTRIQYRGSPPALLDMGAGRIDLMCDQTSTAAAQIKAGTVKAYGVATRERLSILPETPTLTEQGLPFEFSVWQGVYAPAGTPQEAVSKLSAALQAAVRSDAVRQKLAQMAVTVVSPDRATPGAHREFLEQETRRWAEVLKNAEKQ